MEVLNRISCTVAPKYYGKINEQQWQEFRKKNISLCSTNRHENNGKRVEIKRNGWDENRASPEWVNYINVYYYYLFVCAFSSSYHIRVVWGRPSSFCGCWVFRCWLKSARFTFWLHQKIDAEKSQRCTMERKRLLSHNPSRLNRAAIVNWVKHNINIFRKRSIIVFEMWVRARVCAWVLVDKNCCQSLSCLF